MRTTLPARTLGALLLLTWGCGGNVVVDGSSAGSGGSIPGTGGTGGTGTSSNSGPTSSSATSSSTGESSVTCDFGCGGPIGLCGCTGPCSDGKTRAVGCGGTTESGFSCTCDVNGQVVGMCNEPNLVCDLVQSCCGIVFGL
jgi:hypothetical protein